MDSLKYCVICDRYPIEIDLCKEEADIRCYEHQNKTDCFTHSYVSIQNISSLGECLMSEIYKIKARLILKPENIAEDRIIADYDFYSHIFDGEARRGHPEGAIINHIVEVFDNINLYSVGNDERRLLRLIALIHDSFKYKVDRSKPRVDENHHGAIAKNFALKYITGLRTLFVIEEHDVAYNVWRSGSKGGWEQATKRAVALIKKLDALDVLDLYVKFYQCDNETGDKTHECFAWFLNLVNEYKKRNKNEKTNLFY